MKYDYEEQYINNLKNIYYNGFLSMNQRTGIKTLRLPSTQIIIDLQKEFPILCSKKVFWKSAADEILWIMQKHSNKIAELNSKIWDSWADENGTIGKSYGYQIKQKTREFNNQVEYILETLKKDPSNRQCVINMWNVSELDEMNLVPCCYSSVWNIIDGKLNCMLVQRSADYPVGVPFDTTQYAILTHLFARHLNILPGILTHVMADSHIYENQIEGVKKQFKQFEELKIKGKQYPILVFNKNASNDFWKVKLNDFDIINYNPMPIIKFEVAI